MVELDEKDFETLAVCALRYCHGRQTYMPEMVRGIIRPHLGELSDGTLTTLLDDCRFQRQMNMYGDEKIDKPGWLQWEQWLLEERRQRA